MKIDNSHLCGFCTGEGLDGGQEICKPCQGTGIDKQYWAIEILILQGKLHDFKNRLKIKIEELLEIT